MHQDPAAFDVRRPCTRQQAVDHGITPRQLRGRAYRRLHTGIYVAAEIRLTPELRAEAALLPFGPDAYASHATAARIWRLPIPALPDEHVTVADLREFCGHVKGPGAALARQAAGYVRERVDSPMETRLRMLIVLAGLPEPRVNLYVGEIGVEYRKYDLCWPEATLIVEYDGRQHIERVEQWESDLDRREAIDDDQWRIVVVTARGIYRTPDRTVEKLHRLLLERGAHGVPPVLSAAWAAHFPGRE